jgi:DNA-nicking Smr family endonuclease
MARGRRLKDEEAALWKHIARDVTPLPDRDQHQAEPEDEKPLPAPAPPPKKRRVAKPQSAPPPVAPPRPALPELDPAAPAGLDKRTAQRLKRGQLGIEARIDLHGMTQEQAHATLSRFIRESRMAGRRSVLVITGKGSVKSGEGGVLRQMTPRWLNEPTLRRHIVAISQAQQKDGGQGALYVLLKRRRAVAVPGGETG